MRFDALEIDDQVLDKIESRHGVAFREVSEACRSDRRQVRRGRLGLYTVCGRTAAGRYVLVVLAGHGGDVWKVVTAREMTQEERRLYRRTAGG